MTWLWNDMEIPEKYCFKEGKKCTPDCSSYDFGWIYTWNEKEEDKE